MRTHLVACGFNHLLHVHRHVADLVHERRQHEDLLVHSQDAGDDVVYAWQELCELEHLKPKSRTGQ